MLTPYATWRARLPAAIGSWFARDLARAGLALFEGRCVDVHAVEAHKVDALVRDPRGERTVAIEWGGGTGPLGLRALCSCGAGGVCEHVVATLEAVRVQTDPVEREADEEPALDWLPAPQFEGGPARARAVWAVFSSADGANLGANLVLDSPRLR
ncbi:MAG: hypothetical protein ACREM2_08115, partial [Vulcanimicrobiaceae bacterium]